MRSSLKLLSGLVILTCGIAAFAKSEPEAGKDAPKSEKKDDKKKDDKKKGGDDKKKKDDKKKDDDKKGDDKKKKGDDKKDAGLDLPLVPHIPSTGLKIPYKDAKGNLQMIYYIGTATRLNDDVVEMKETKVESYNDEGEVAMTVDLPVSELNLKTRIVTSQTKTTITREDFTITGDGVKFDTNPDHRVASLVGHVRMIVYDQKDEEATPPPAAPVANE